MEYYEIIVESHLDQKRLKDFNGMGYELEPSGRTLLYGNLKDQSELFSVLNKIRDMNLNLISVNKRMKEDVR